MASIQAARPGEPYREETSGWTHILSPDPSDILCIEEAANVKLAETGPGEAPRIGEVMLSTSCIRQLETLRMLAASEPALRPAKITVLVPGDDRELGIAGLVLEYTARGTLGVHTTYTLVEGSPRASGDGYYRFLASAYEAVADEASRQAAPAIVNVDSSHSSLTTALTLAAITGGAKAVYSSHPDGGIQVTPLPVIDVDVDQLELLSLNPKIAPWTIATKHLQPGHPPVLNEWLRRLLER